MRTALQYADAGLSVVPLRPREKRPLVAWGEFQRRKPTTPEIAGWWGAFPEAGVAVVCGRVSSLLVLDEDPRHGGDVSLARYPMPRGPVVFTGGGGRHFYLALNGESSAKVGGLLPGVDVLGEGSLATAPPSVHPGGQPYRWAPGRALGQVPLPPLPGWLRRLLAEHHRASLGAHGRQSVGQAPLALQGVLGCLKGVRRSGDGWIARCPAHDDHTPSLSIGVGAGGKVLLHCFSGCAFKAIRIALEDAT